MTNISSEINGMQNATAQIEATKPKSDSMGKDVFLKLMLEQLKYQDPMEPVSNQEFLAQQAQFTQLDTTQQMKENIADSNSVMQTLTLIGKTVALDDPNNPGEIISGVVDGANIDGKNSSIIVGGTEYPLSLIRAVGMAPASPTTST